MGKEVIGPKRKYEVIVTPGVHANKRYLEWVGTQQWSNPAVFPSPEDIFEDCSAKIIIRDGVNQFNTVCTGLKRKGNTFGYLIKLLKEKKLIPRNKSNVTFLIKNGFDWKKVDEAIERFDSESCIMALISVKRKKIITKVK